MSNLTRSLMLGSSGGFAFVDNDGASLLPSLSFTQFGTTTGILYPDGHYGDILYTYSATSPGQTIEFANRAVFDYDTAGASSGIGHFGAHLAWFKRTGAGDVGFVLAGEDKFENNNAAGTVAQGKGREVQLSANLGTISLWSGVTSQIVTNAGTVSVAVLNNVDVAANAGTLGTVYGYLISDMSARSIGTRYGLKNLDPGAPIHSLAPIVDGAIARAAPTSGATVEIYTASTKQAATRLELQHGSTIAALTINLPSAAQMEDGHTLKIIALGGVTTVTWTGTSGAMALLNALATSITAYVALRLWYSASANIWYLE